MVLFLFVLFLLRTQLITIQNYSITKITLMLSLSSHSHHPLSPYLPKPLATTNMFFISKVFLFRACYVSGIPHYVIFEIGFFCFICFWDPSNLSCLSRVCSFLFRVVLLGMDVLDCSVIYLLINILVDSCYWLSQIKLLWTLVYIFVWT